MYISASIFSNNSKSIDTLLEELALFEIDYLHIDCNDDVQVFEEVKRIQAKTTTPLDIHIIAAQPDKYYSYINAVKPHQVCFQIENCLDKIDFAQLDAPSKGIAICSGTDMGVLAAYENQIDYVLIMTTTPGKSGGVFKKENFNYIQAIRSRFPALKIQVDGGVNHEVSFILRVLGVDGIVSGSYLVNHDHIGVAYVQLTAKNIPSHFLLEDFMMPLETLPIARMDQTNLYEILALNEQYKLGCTFIVDNENKLMGLSTGADIRRGLLKNNLDIRGALIQDFININPVVAYRSNDIQTMLENIKAHPFPILVLPVLEKDRTLCGLIMFNNLIKGE